MIISKEQVKEIVNKLAALQVPVIVASNMILPIIKLLQSLPEADKKEVTP